MLRFPRATMLALALAGLAMAAPGLAGTLADALAALNVVPLDLRPAPDFTLMRLDGTSMRLRDQHGQAVVLYFWATW